MDYLRERTFELFRYTLPGLFLLFVVSLFDERVNNPIKSYDLFFKEIPTEVIFGLLILGFINGLVIDQFSGKLFGILRRKKTLNKQKSDLPISHKYALIRELSPTNFHHIENWNVSKGMCENLSFGFLCLFVIAIFKTFISDFKISWIALIIISVVSMISLISKAWQFKRWAKGDLDAAVAMMDEITKNIKN